MISFLRIAVDGPAGSGKSTVSKVVAAKLGIAYLDTGAMYRSGAWMKLELGLENTDLYERLKQTDFNFFFKDGVQRLVLKYDNNEHDVTDAIRTPEVTALVSSVAKDPVVREILTEKQREIGEKQSVIMDGRDIGTVVMPHAELKFFLVASVEERAKRRMLEWKEKGEDVSLEQIAADIKKRDAEDESRETAPLKKAEDAEEIDTTYLTIDEVISIIAAEADGYQRRIEV